MLNCSWFFNNIVFHMVVQETSSKANELRHTLRLLSWRSMQKENSQASRFPRLIDKKNPFKLVYRPLCRLSIRSSLQMVDYM